jgi:hypothetical protein
MASKDPAALLESWRELFSRDPMNVRIDMSRAASASGDIDGREIADLVRQFAGRPEEYAKAVNSRIGKR